MIKDLEELPDDFLEFVKYVDDEVSIFFKDTDNDGNDYDWKEVLQNEWKKYKRRN